MRTQQEFSDELNRRVQQRIASQKTRRLRIFTACVSAAVCIALLILFLPQTSTVSAQNLMDSITPAAVAGKEPDEAFRLAQTDFALRIFQASVAETETDNALVSPLSVMLALSMTANGADGETKAEMEAILGMPVEDLNRYLYSYVNQLPSNDSAKLSIANSIWFRDNERRLQVSRAFLQTNADYYKAAAYAAPFDRTTLNDINHWVTLKTDGMIDKILDEINEDTVLYLINALVFDAKWKAPYKDDTMIYEGTFTAHNGQAQAVTMMHQREFGYLSDGMATGFIKAYEGGSYQFVAMLPNEGVTLAEYVDFLTAEGITHMLSHVEKASVDATIPQFSYDYDIHLNEILKEMGMPSAFSGVSADFTKMATSSDGNIYIGDVLHKTHITVDTHGTRAAAVTKVEMTNESVEMYAYAVKLDRPFLYMIVDSATNLPIFIGTVNSVSDNAS